MEHGDRDTVEAVLPDAVYRDVDLGSHLPMLCAEITDRRQTSHIIRVLNEQFPLSEFTHLKRVRGGEKLRVLVCTLESENTDLVKVSNDQLQKLDLSGLGGTSEVHVPQYKPITRSQYDHVSQLWPTHFHEDKKLEKTIRGEMFSPKELSDIKRFMQIALEQAKSKVSSSVLIVDHDTNTVIAQACTDTSHPLKHATMVCLDRVALLQGAGAWHETGSAKYSSATVVKSESQLKGHGDVNRCKDNEDTSHGPSAKRVKIQYLCTGYDAYCTTEPCIMCSMALLHSRIRRVFFYRINSSSGGLYSHYKLHTHRGLNHHFEVYKCVFPSSKMY